MYDMIADCTFLRESNPRFDFINYCLIYCTQYLQTGWAQVRA